MVRRCCVADCKESDITILAHRFPKTIEVATKWRNALDLQNVTIDDLQKKFVVCTKHFAAAAYRNEISTSLNTTAVPNLDYNASNHRISIKGHLLKKIKEKLSENLHLDTSPKAPAPTDSVVFISRKDSNPNVYTNQPSKKRKLEASSEILQEVSPETYVEQLVPIENQPEIFENCEYTVEETFDDVEEEEAMQHDKINPLFLSQEITFSHKETQTDEPPECTVKETAITQPQESKDDKIIKILYPEYKEMNKMSLIELISEKNQKIEALEGKVKKLEEAMKSFL